MKEHKLTFSAEMVAGSLENKKLGTADLFEILFIHAGEANGFTFSKDVLKASAPLWEDCSVFVDHSLMGRSVRDLGGVLFNVAWSDEFNGLVAELKATGPSREIVLEAARTMFADGNKPDVGFSADVIFAADAENNVQKIMQPLSVDLVIDPAFATKFIRQLNQEGANMTVPAIPVPTPEPPVTHEDVTVAQSFQLAMGEQLLNTALSNSELPDSAQKAIRHAFSGKLYKPAELTESITAWKETIAAATAPAEINGPARVHGMFDSADQLQAAIDDMLGAPRNAGAEALKVAQFSGIKEAYARFTGDTDMVGGYFRDRVQFTHVSASLPGMLVNALNKSLQERWKLLGRAGYDWWTKIVSVEHFNSVQDIAWLLFGTVGSLPTVEENAEYTELKIGDAKETSSFTKYGGYIGISLEAIDKDDTRKLKAIPNELANAGLRNLSSLIAAVFTTGSAAGPTMADTGALFNAVAVTTKGGHANLLTTALGTDFTAWDAVAKAMYNQPMLIASEAGYYGTGKKMAIEPKYCLVPRALKAQAEALFIPRWAMQNNMGGIQSSGAQTYPGYVEPITVPEWTDATDWAAVADPAIVPGIMVGERFGLVPQIFVAGNDTDPAMFSNDESRIKVRHFLAVGVADFRGMHKSNVTGG